MLIRELEPHDWSEVWPLLRATFAAGDTYSFAPDGSEADIRRAWIDTPRATFVAEIARLTKQRGPTGRWVFEDA